MYKRQILDVVEYLNKAYYKFEKPAQQNAAVDSGSEKAEAIADKPGKSVILTNAKNE